MDLSDLDAGELATLQGLITRGLASLPAAQRADAEGLAVKVYAAVDAAGAAHRARKMDALHVEALHESVQRLLLDGSTNRHDDGLILALLAAGDSVWTVAAKLCVSDSYVRTVSVRAAR